MDVMSRAYSSRPLLLVGNGRDAFQFDETEICDEVDSHGVVLFRGFGPEPEDLYRFASRFNKGFLTSPFPDRKVISSDNELQTVTLDHAGLRQSSNVALEQQAKAIRDIPTLNYGKGKSINIQREAASCRRQRGI